MSHLCHAHGCGVEVPARRFACYSHWSKLRKPLRDAIWREYEPGQEVTKTPSLRYMAVQRRAVAEMAFKPNDEEAAFIAARYLLASEVYRQAAIEEGHGDPLEGIDAVTEET